MGLSWPGRPGTGWPTLFLFLIRALIGVNASLGRFTSASICAGGRIATGYDKLAANSSHRSGFGCTVLLCQARPRSYRQNAFLKAVRSRHELQDPLFY
jgi:hypothetical protein